MSVLEIDLANYLQRYLCYRNTKKNKSLKGDVIKPSLIKSMEFYDENDK